MVKDSALIVRASSDGALAYVAAGVDLGPFDIGGTPLRGKALVVNIPATIVSTPLLQVNVHASTTSAAATTDVIIASRTGMTANAEYIIPFSTRKRSVLFDFLVTGATSASFSTVTAAIVLGNGQDWTRTVEFV